MRPSEHDEQEIADSGRALTIERYAEVLAHVIHFGAAQQSEVLARFGIDEAAWIAADADWTKALIDEALADDRPVASAFAASFAPVRVRLKVAKPAIESLGPLVTPPEPEPHPRVEQTRGQDEPAVLLPALRPQDTPEMRWARWAGAQADQSSDTLSSTSMAVVVPKKPALPFASTATPSPATPVASNSAGAMADKMPRVTRAPAELTGTSMAIVMPKRPALPFGPDPAAASAPVARASAEAAADKPADARAKMPAAVEAAPAELTGTSMAIVMPKRPALPFEPDRASPSSVAPAPPKAAAEKRPDASAHNPPAVQAAPAELSGTSMAIIMPKRPALPFAPDPAGGGQPTSQATTPEAPGVASVEPAVAGASQQASASSSAQPADPAIGPQRGLSLEQYASLCVELAAAPAAQDEVLHRYSITIWQREKLDTYWQGRFASDPTARPAFERAYSRYQAWFVTARRR